MSDEQRTPLSRLLKRFDNIAGQWMVEIPSDWKQGRAVYGGLTAALCVHAARKSFPTLPELRSVLITFIGPANEDTIALNAIKLREGSSASFVEVAVTSGAEPVARALLCFGKARESSLSGQWIETPQVIDLAQAPPFFEAGPAPTFAQHFHSKFAAGYVPASSAERGELTVWLQHKDEQHRNSELGLLSLGDGLPPSAMTMLERFVPVSTMTWMFDIVGNFRDNPGGWWLSSSTCESVGEGYSSQRMIVRNHLGAPVLIGRQNCAIFG